MMTLATRLEKLVLHEISGVDSPANEAPGFAIFKSKDSPQDAATEASSDGRVTTIFGKLRDAVTGGKGDDLDMDRSELEGILEERDERLLAGVADVVKGLLPATDETTEEAVEKDATTDEVEEVAVEKDATDESATDETEVEKTEGESTEKDETTEEAAVEKTATDEVVEQTTPALTAEDVAKAVSEALAPHLEVSQALFARIEAVEARFAGVARKSLVEGNETVDETPSTPTVKSAFDAALQGRKVELR